MIFTGNLPAFSSAFWARCTRRKSEWTRSAWAILVPILSDWIMMPTRDLTVWAPVRSPRFFSASFPGNPGAQLGVGEVQFVVHFHGDLCGPHRIPGGEWTATTVPPPRRQ